MKKRKYFEAFLNELLKWYQEENWNRVENNLSKLKVLKLLFLGVSKNKEALVIFNKFQAWDLWPVEKDIYDEIKNNTLEKFIVDNIKTTIRSDIQFWVDETSFAKETITFLKNKNANLINLSASSLVDITHKWNCWDLAKSFDFDIIFPSLILSEDWYYN